MIVRVGDIGLTGIQSQGWVSKLIKLGAFVGRYPKDARRFSHAFLVTDDDGEIVEAVKRGVRPAHISKYKPDDFVVVPMGVDAHDAAQIVAFANSVVTAKWRYGFATFAACGFNCLFAHWRWLPFSFSVSHTAICSGFVADALTRAGCIFDKPVEVTMPADLWVQFGSRVA